MSVQLLSITFNLSPGDVTQPSITLRQNFAEPVRIPEWRHGETLIPEHCPVAYSSAARNRPVSIRVRMRGPAGRAFSIRALGPDLLNQIALGCMFPWLSWLLPRRRWQQLSMLGEVPIFTISFPQGQNAEPTTEAEVTVQLRGHTIGNMGIWVSNTSWRWQYWDRRWTDIITTHHRAYCVTSHPTPPWQQDYMNGSNTKLPWVDALEFACEWAGLAREYNDVFRALVRGVWNQGIRGLLSYNAAPGAGCQFCGPSRDQPYNLTGLLDHLRRGTEVMPVNCVDCAILVSTLANLLGLNLEQYYFSLPGVGSRVLPLGHQQPMRINWFEHVVARAPRGPVWDAAIQLNQRSEPPEEPFLGQMVFGIPWDNYRRLLLRSDGLGSLNPIESVRSDVI